MDFVLTAWGESIIVSLGDLLDLGYKSLTMLPFQTDARYCLFCFQTTDPAPLEGCANHAIMLETVRTKQGQPCISRAATVSPAVTVAVLAHQ